MRIKNKFLRVLVWIVSILVIIAVVVALAIYSYLQFYFLPKFNENVVTDNDKISVADIAKDFGDSQIIGNIINYDKQSASEMLNLIDEIDSEEKAAEQETTPSEKNNSEKTDSKANTTTDGEKTENAPASAEGSTARERIMNAASKEEISQGAAILSKISMSKVNELRKSGDTAALKAYIKSTLSSSEISTALKLYNKYKHLL